MKRNLFSFTLEYDTSGGNQSGKTTNSDSQTNDSFSDDPDIPSGDEVNTSSGSLNNSPISYDVPLIPQPNKFDCWDAFMSMVFSYKKQKSIDPETLAYEVERSLRISYSWDILEEVRDHFGFVSVIDVPAETCVNYEPKQWKEWMEKYGPFWYTFIWAKGSSHAMVLKGINGDLTNKGTTMEIQNPWDLNTTFDNNPVDFNTFNTGTTQRLSFLNFSSLFADHGYDVDHASFRIMYLH